MNHSAVAPVAEVSGQLSSMKPTPAATLVHAGFAPARVPETVPWSVPSTYSDWEVVPAASTA